jgi:uncharacterized protein (AIM24 family)
MHPTYMQIRISIASIGAMPIVRVESSATAIVAVRPGSMPMMMPSCVAQSV